MAAAALVCGLLGAGCSTPLYTSDQGVTDLQTKAHLTHAQAQCVIDAIREHFATAIKAKQAANKLTPLPADRLKLEVDNALATIRSPTVGERTAARNAVFKCAPQALEPNPAP